MAEAAILLGIKMFHVEHFKTLEHFEDFPYLLFHSRPTLWYGYYMQRSQCQIIAVSNQKGGVGKTTSAVSLSAELALQGRRVLLVDFDPQGNASSGLGVPRRAESPDLYDVFFSESPIRQILAPCAVEGLLVAPSSADLISVEIELGKTPGRELILRTQLASVLNDFDYIFIDCPPSSGLLSLNAMGAAQSVLIPVQAEYYALEGLSALMNTLDFVQKTFNPTLKIIGAFLTMYDGRTNLSSQVEAEVRNHFGDLVFKTRIPRNIRLSEAPSHGLPICLYDPESSGATSYHELSKELGKRAFPNQIVNIDAQEAAPERAEGEELAANS